MQFSVVWRSVLSIPSEDFMNQPQKISILFQRECGVEPSRGRRIEGGPAFHWVGGIYPGPLALVKGNPRHYGTWMICAYLSVSWHATIRTSFLSFYSEKKKSHAPTNGSRKKRDFEWGRYYNCCTSSPKISQHIVQIMRSFFGIGEGWLVSRINKRLTGYSICQ